MEEALLAPVPMEIMVQTALLLALLVQAVPLRPVVARVATVVDLMLQ